MRNMSFMLTTEQIKNKTKTVTRRLGWKDLKPGTLIRACEKCQGLKKGEKIKHLAILRVISVERHRLYDMAYIYDDKEPAREGLPEMSPYEFVQMFAKEMNCNVSDYVTRIKFDYVEDQS